MVKSNKKELTLEQREKNIKKAELSALFMVIASVVVLVASFTMISTLYKTYKVTVDSPYYKGLSDRDNENDILEDSFKLMTEVENIYEASYVLDIEREDIDENLVNALMTAYGDKYAIYRNPEDTYVSNNSRNHKLEGVGIYMVPEYEDSEDIFKLYMIDVYAESPAEKAGIEIGDYITKVNGKELSKTKYDYFEIREDMRDEAGTSVDITFIDSSDNNIEKTVTVIRDNVPFTRTVVHEKVAEDIALITVREFDLKTDEEFITAVDGYLNQGINKFIFDLRSNPGGLKENTINILDYLLPSGLLLNEVDKEGNIISENLSDNRHVDFNSVCIVDEGTASAAELFTQTLRDFGVTTVIGETTLGKGTVCTLFPLSNGGSIFVSTSRYVTKSGYEIEEVGIVPDIEMKLPEDKEKIAFRLSIDDNDLIQRAIEELK